MKWLKRVLPFIISAILLVIIARLAPWPEVIKILSGLNWLAIVSLLVCSLLYYLIKAYRFWYMLLSINVKEPLGAVILIYLSAQPVTLLPAGELYRPKAMERYRGVPISRTIPTFTTQGLFEGLGLAVVGLSAAFALGISRLPALILLILVAIAIVGVRMGYLENITRAINKLPFVHLSRQKIKSFSERNKIMFKGTDFWILSGLSFLIELLGVGIALISVNSLGGEIGVSQAALVYVIPLIVGFISFLPGGFGAAEQSAIGLLLLMGQGGALAVAATILIRAFLVGSGLVYSVIAWSVIKLIPGIKKPQT